MAIYKITEEEYDQAIDKIEELADEAMRERDARRKLRAEICQVYSNTDPASFAHARQPDHIEGWHRRLREILAEDLVR